MKSIFCDFFYLTLLYRYRASDFQFPFGPSTFGSSLRSGAGGSFSSTKSTPQAW